MADRVNLGDLVRDRISGFEGVCTSTAQYLTGCDRVGISPRTRKPDGSLADTLWFDEPWVEVIETNVVQPVEPRKTDAGGPSHGMNIGNSL